MPSGEFYLDFAGCRELLATRLAEPPPTRIQVLAGPRQVGKTTLLLELAEPFGDAALYLAADGPETTLPGFWERLWARATELGRSGRAVVMIDEIHLLNDWAARLKGEWDRIRRAKLDVHVVISGSSALRLGEGTRESLAGRFERMTLTHWSASSLSSVFGVPEQNAADLFVERGSYPGAFGLRDNPRRWTAYVRDSILEPAIGRDILALAEVRKPGLLRQVFGVCVASPAQIVALKKIQGQLQDPGALETIAGYLSLLEEAFLIAPLEKYAKRPARRRAAPPKLVTLNNALLAVTDPRGPPTVESDPARHGAWVENACLAHAWCAGQRVSYFREEPLEVDAVLEGSWGSWAIEVKTGAIRPRDLAGLSQFVAQNPGFRPLVLCDETSRTSVERAGLPSRSWREFLLRGPA